MESTVKKVSRGLRCGYEPMDVALLRLCVRVRAFSQLTNCWETVGHSQCNLPHSLVCLLFQNHWFLCENVQAVYVNFSWLECWIFLFFEFSEIAFVTGTRTMFIGTRICSTWYLTWFDSKQSIVILIARHWMTYIKRIEQTSQCTIFFNVFTRASFSVRAIDLTCNYAEQLWRIRIDRSKWNW